MKQSFLPKPMMHTLMTRLRPSFRSASAVATLACASATALAQDVDVKSAWIRTSVQGQMSTGAFMTLTAKHGSRLVGAVSPIAAVVEVHEMKMDGDVMKMRALPEGLALPQGKAVELKPGGYHVMLMDLKAALPKGSTVPLTLLFKDAKGVETRLELKLPAAVTAPGGSGQDTSHKH